MSRRAILTFCFGMILSTVIVEAAELPPLYASTKLGSMQVDKFQSTELNMAGVAVGYRLSRAYDIETEYLVPSNDGELVENGEKGKYSIQTLGIYTNYKHKFSQQFYGKLRAGVLYEYITKTFQNFNIEELHEGGVGVSAGIGAGWILAFDKQPFQIEIAATIVDKNATNFLLGLAIPFGKNSHQTIVDADDISNTTNDETENSAIANVETTEDNVVTDEPRLNYTNERISNNPNTAIRSEIHVPPPLATPKPRIDKNDSTVFVVSNPSVVAKPVSADVKIEPLNMPVVKEEPPKTKMIKPPVKRVISHKSIKQVENVRLVPVPKKAKTENQPTSNAQIVQEPDIHSSDMKPITPLSLTETEKVSLYTKGITAFSQGRLQESIAHLSTLVSVDPGYEGGNAKNYLLRATGLSNGLKNVP